jgi:hypothetical protein
LLNQGGLVVVGNGTPLLEVRFRNDGHPPFIKREREIRLNGTSGVKFWDARVEISIRAFFCAQRD